MKQAIHHPIPVEKRFQNVRAENSRGIFASEGPLFKGAVFGRDSIEVAEDLIGIDRAIPHEIIITLASLQGLGTDRDTEEEPGKIHHEHRLKGDIKDAHSHEVFERLSMMWGGNEHELTYYGSADATPLFVRMVGQYTEVYGLSILEEQIMGKDGVIRPVSEHLKMAKKWIDRKLRESSMGLIEYKRTNPVGIENQVWKDSVTGYIHENGELLNYDFGIAALEVQCYAYDAYKCLAKLFPGLVSNDELNAFRRHIINLYWLPQQSIFASAIEKDDAGNPRQLTSSQSNSGLILDSDVLLDEPGSEDMAKHTMTQLMSADFLTPAGIRCRSLTLKDAVDYPDYHGSYAVWFKESSDIVRGFQKHGFLEAAKLLARNIVSAITELGEFYEFVFVDENGTLVAPTNQTGLFSDPRCNHPEPGQSWTISAFVRSLRVINDEQ